MLDLIAKIDNPKEQKNSLIACWNMLLKEKEVEIKPYQESKYYNLNDITFKRKKEEEIIITTIDLQQEIRQIKQELKELKDEQEDIKYKLLELESRKQYDKRRARLY